MDLRILSAAPSSEELVDKVRMVRRTLAEGLHEGDQRSPGATLLCLSLMALVSDAARLYGIGEPPMDFQSVRQYHSALLARGFYEWLSTGELRTMPPDGLIEPPILESVASFAYYLLGGEHIWMPRVLSASSWMVGGVFLYLLAKRMFSAGAALFSVAFYLFLPYAVLPSRAFMPEAPMIGALVAAVYAIWRYHEEPSTGRLLVAAVASSLALLLKPGICFWQVFLAFGFLEIRRVGLKGALIDVRAYAFAALSLLPMGLWYAYGAWWAGFLSGQVSAKILPWLLLEPYYWEGWLDRIGFVVGYAAFAGGLVGLFLAGRGAQRALLWGLWAGYVLFGFTFTRHIHTHDYYTLQLIPIVALSLGPLVGRAFGYLKSDGPVTVRAVVLLLLVSAAEHQASARGLVEQGRGTAFPGWTVGNTTVADYERRAKIYEEVGRIVGHANVVHLAPDFGWSLLYHGRLRGPFWPTPGWEESQRSAGREQPSPEKRLDAFLGQGSPEYFVVFRRFAYYGNVEDWEGREYGKLRRMLRTRYPIEARTRNYVVFDLREEKPASGTLTN